MSTKAKLQVLVCVSEPQSHSKFLLSTPPLLHSFDPANLVFTPFRIIWLDEPIPVNNTVMNMHTSCQLIVFSLTRIMNAEFESFALFFLFFILNWPQLLILQTVTYDTHASFREKTCFWIQRNWFVFTIQPAVHLLTSLAFPYIK